MNTGILMRRLENHLATKDLCQTSRTSDSRLVRPIRSSARVHVKIAAQVAAAALGSVLLIAATSKALADDPLPSWNNTAPKKAIVAFVEKVTKEGSPDFVRPGERIAAFDNDGTLWAEQPIYFQVFFTVDCVKALLPQHPEWKHEEPFASLLKDDMKAVSAMPEKGNRQTHGRYPRPARLPTSATRRNSSNWEEH